MRGLLQAALLLAPALANGNPLQSNEDAIPSAYIRLHPFEEDVHELTFRLDINESKDACGYANITINGETLPRGGRGSLSLDQGTTVIANWNFTCVSWNGHSQEQLMSLGIDSVEGKVVEDLGFTIRFQQVAPVWISDIEGPATMTRVHKAKMEQPPSGPDCHNEDGKGAKGELDLEEELAELDYLRYQVHELHELVRMKERHLAEAFGWSNPHPHHGPHGKGKGMGGPRGHMFGRPGRPFNLEAGALRDCDSIKCILNSIYHKISNAAVAFYGEVAEYEDFFDGPGGHGHGGPHPHGHKKPGKEFPPPPPDNHSQHGNHTFPPPPFKRPHHPPGKVPFHPPPFCRCPSTPPHHGPFGGDESAMDGFPGLGFPGHHRLPPPGDQEPPKHGFHGELPPLPSFEDDEEPRRHGGFPGDHPPEHGKPPMHGFPGEHGPEHGGFPGEHPPHHRPEDEHEHGDFLPFEGHRQKGHGHGHGPDGEHDMPPHHPFEHEDDEPERPFPPPEHGHEDGPGHRGPPGPPPFDGPDGRPPPPPGHGPPDFDGPHGPPPPPPPHDNHGFFRFHFSGLNGPPPPPPPPPGQGPPFDGPDGMPPPPPPPPGHGPPPPGFHGHGPHGHGPMLSPVKIGVLAILLFVLTAALHKRVCMRFRGSRADRLVARQEAFRRHHARGFFGRLFFGRYPRYWDDEDENEKARLLRLGGSDKYDCTRTDTVAQEIASFRTAADVVSEMVAAEEGRVQQQLQQLAVPQPPSEAQLVRSMQEQQANAATMPPLLSPNSAFAHYMTSTTMDDEALPAYEYVRDEGSDGDSLVSDGFSDYTPSSSGSRPPVGSGADDVLGDTKH